MTTKSSFYKAGDRVMILEFLNQPLSVKKVEGEKNSYIFSGIAAEFGIRNDNMRLYESGDYLPHLEYLSKEIEQKSLFGQMNHPGDYNVDMNNVSHRINELKFNEAENTVDIVIELFDTASGKNAAAIADKGSPLYISSRASGRISKEGKVVLEKIYTYDIVYKPGFSRAKMNRINESKSFENEKDLLQIMEKYENVYIFPINESAGQTNTQTNEINNETKNNGGLTMEAKDREFVEELIRNSENSFKQKISVLETKLADKDKEIKQVKTDCELKVKKMEGFVSEIHEEFKSAGNSSNKKFYKQVDSIEIGSKTATKLDYIPNLNETIKFDGISFKIEKITPIKELAAGGDKTFAKLVEDGYKHFYELSVGGVTTTAISNESGEVYLQKTSESSSLLVSKRMDALEGTIGKIVEYLELIKIGNNQIVEAIADGQGNTEGIIKYLENFKQVFEKHVGFTDLMSLFVNKLADHNDLIAEMSNTHMDHSDLVVEFVNQLANHADLTSKAFNEVTESLNAGGLPFTRPDKTKQETETIDYSSLGSKVTDILKRVEEQGTQVEKTALIVAFPIAENFSETQKVTFAGLNDAKKQEVVAELKKLKTVTEQAVETALANVTSVLDNLPVIKLMPEEYKGIWESMEHNDQKRVIALSRTRNLFDSLSVKTFWDSLDTRKASAEFQRRKKEGSTTLNEGKDENGKTKEEREKEFSAISELGYSEAAMDAMLGLR